MTTCPEELLGKKVAEGSDAQESGDTVDPREVAALAVDRAVREAKMADWRGRPIKEKRIGAAIQGRSRSA